MMIDIFNILVLDPVEAIFLSHSLLTFTFRYPVNPVDPSLSLSMSYYPSPQVDSVVRGVHAGGADLHHHGADEEWKPSRILAGGHRENCTCLFFLNDFLLF